MPTGVRPRALGGAGNRGGRLPPGGARNRGESFPGSWVPALLPAYIGGATLTHNVKEVGPERVGRALRKMAEDLVTERRRVVLLQRENRELRSQLEELQRLLAAEREPAPGATHE